MRFSTKQNVTQSLNAMLTQQSNMAEIQKRISTGKKILTPSDNPTDSQEIISSRQMISKLQQYQGNIDLLDVQLNLKQNTLETISSLAADIETQAISASDNLTSQSTIEGIATQVESLLSMLVSKANERNSSGEYIFSGYATDTQPYSKNGSGNYVYNGDPSSREVQVSNSLELAVSEPGSALFDMTPVTAATARTGGTGDISVGAITDTATWQAALPQAYTLSYDGTNINISGDDGYSASTAYTSGETITINGLEVNISGTLTAGTSAFTVTPLPKQNIMNKTQALVNSLRNDTGADLAKSVEDFQLYIDSFQLSVIGNQADVGVRQSIAESQGALNSALITNESEGITALEDTDVVEEMAKFSFETLALEAAQQAFVRMGQLSLVNIL